jgi:hypothetical protein
MAGILDYNKGIYSTQGFRNSLLNRNLPLPVNETLTQSGLVSKLQDIGTVISVPVNGEANENIPVHYDVNKRLFPLGNLYRTTQNVNFNRYIPQDDVYEVFEFSYPPKLGYPLPEGFGEKVRDDYPAFYNQEQFFLINKGDQKGVKFPFNVIDTYKSLNFQRESSLGLIGGQELEKTILNKISQISEETGNSNKKTGFITEPIGNIVDNYVNKLRGSDQFFNTLPNNAVGWNEYNSSAKSGSELLKSDLDIQEGVEPTLSTEIRMNTLLSRTSSTQVSFAFNLMNRNDYRPLYEDRRLAGTSDAGLNSRYYVGTEKSTNRGSLITKKFTSADFNGGVDTSGNAKRTTVEGIGEPFGEDNKFFWTTGGEQNFNEKTLLYKTQQLVNDFQNDVFINQTKKYFKDKEQNRVISRGNAIKTLDLIDIDGNGNFCRVWTVNDRYSYANAIRNTGLFSSPSIDLQGFSVSNNQASQSVLMSNGIPKIHPSILDSSTTRKKFMLSIENLAWTDNLADLPLSEIGPGDLLSGNKGRIMWFPPYELTFDENTSANWNKTDFIGRSEPVYTYNNSSRSGSLSFKIIVDHPRVINCYRGNSTNLTERFFAGCATPDEFLRALECSVPQSDLEEIKKKIKEKEPQKKVDVESSKKDGKVIFKQDITCTSTTENCKAQRTPVEANLTSIVSLIKEFLEKQSKNTNPKVKITLNGWVGEASLIDPISQERVGDGTTLSKEFANKVKTEIETRLKNSGIDPKLITNITLIESKGNVAVSSDTESDYRVDVVMENDTQNSKDSQPKEEEKDDGSFTIPEDIRLIDNLIIDEGTYFDFIDENYPNYFKYISEKIKYFHAGFHSITPEGFNSRLTFLNQCMRQGPSIYDRVTQKDGTEVGVQPQNLSFGRPPICILRIGDFFHTKVAINSLSITYDGPQWDLNPEGIGVQPMIATVSLGIDYIGGHSLVGPLNRLQNAVSFNYYANTEMYDVRSDKVDYNTGKVIDGIKLGELKKQLVGEENLNKYINSLKKEGIVNQTKDNENSDNGKGSENTGVLDISVEKPSKIVVKTKDGKAASDIEVDGEKSPDNSIVVKVKVGKSSDEGKSLNTATSFDIDCSEENPKFKGKIVNFETLTVKKKAVEDALATYIVLKTQKVADNNSVTNAQLKKAENDFNDKEKELKKYEGSVSSSVEVTAYLSKNKKTTTVNKTFTITENGLT